MSAGNWGGGGLIFFLGGPKFPPRIAVRFSGDFFGYFLAIFLRSLRQNLRFCTLRYENPANFLAIAFFFLGR